MNLVPELHTHDLETAAMDLKILCHLIRSGYRFNDDNTPMILDRMEKALRAVESAVRKKQRTENTAQDLA